MSLESEDEGGYVSDEWELSSLIWDTSAPNSPTDGSVNNPSDDSDNSELDGTPSNSPDTPAPNSPPNAPQQPSSDYTKDEKLTQLMEHVIQELKAEDYSFAQWLAFIFDKKRGGRTVELRREHFWKHPSEVNSLLEHWVHSHQYGPGRELVLNWVRSRVAKEMRGEADKVTSSKFLQSSQLDIGPEYLENFQIQDLRDELQANCGVSIQMFLAMAGVELSVTTLGGAPASARNVVMYAMAAILRENNRLNNLIQIIFSLYMYACGLQRQAFSILSHIGLLVSYTHLVSGLGVSGQHRKKRRANPSGEEEPSVEGQGQTRKKESPTGPLKALANGCLERLRRLASDVSPVELGFIFDNINLVRKVAEQVLGRIDTQMNGTCATVFELDGVTPGALDQDQAMESFLAAPPLQRTDILLTPDEQALHRRLMVYNILRIIVQHGGESFARYHKELEKSQPATPHRLTLHRTKVYSLPAMEIEESSVDGVIDVMTEMYAALKIDTTTPKFRDTVHFVGGDQKSISHLRSAKNSRAGNDDPAYSFANLTPLIGLFHTLMAVIIGFITVHFGNPTANVNNPGSLSYHNTVLERKPFALTSLPPVSVSRNLINVSLIARILHCLTLTTGSTLEDYAQHLATLDTGEKLDKSWAQLVSDATELYDQYANAQTVHDLRSARKFASAEEKAGDMVYENALLFLRDGLNMRELITATKRGDPGCIVLLLKVLALSFRGSGRAQYAFEALSLIHHVQSIWPEPLRNLALRNWLLNPTGKIDAWVPLDLVQEHANFWIKTVYNATGSNASWSWLAAISPCAEALRNLVKDLNSTLGTYQGVKHTTPDVSLDIAKLMRSLKTHKVYQLCPGRTLNDEDKPVIDVESVGLQKLVDGRHSGLSEYNRGFKSTQEAHRQVPVSSMPPHSSLPRRPPEIVEGMVQAQTQIDAQTEAQGNTLENQSEDGEDIEGEDEDEVEGVGSEMGSETGSVTMVAGETAGDFDMDDYADYWPAQDEESWIEDLAIFDD